MVTYSLPELADVAGIEPRTLTNWLRRGLLVASAQRANGSGTRNLFSEADAAQAIVLADLRKAGMGLPGLERVAEAIDTSADKPAQGFVVVNGRVSVCSDEETLSELVTCHSPTFVYDLSHAYERLSSRS